MAFLRRHAATEVAIADDGVADAADAVAVPAAQPISDFYAEAIRLLGSTARLRVLGGVVRLRTYTGADERLRLRASGRAVVQTPHAEHVSASDEQDGGVVGEGLGGAPLHALGERLLRPAFGFSEPLDRATDCVAGHAQRVSPRPLAFCIRHERWRGARRGRGSSAGGLRNAKVAVSPPVRRTSSVQRMWGNSTPSGPAAP
jgi:hypothetical protein